jgi:metal-sulfur cluster biosynthetic enzyme
VTAAPSARTGGRVAGDLGADVCAALEGVLDPCSVGNGSPMSVLDLGLVCDWTREPDGMLNVRMCVTAPTCIMAPHFLVEAQRALSAIEGVSGAICWIDPSVTWTPERMSARAASILRTVRDRRRPEPPDGA